MDNKGLINIYKASAGSGKTFRITLNFLKLIVENPDNYAGILAVTFTNKATNEMKSRIFEQLYGIANGLKDSETYVDALISECNYSERQIRKNTKIALTKMLHNFSLFHVETIDSFFQSIFRNMAKELDLGAALNIKIDYGETLRAAIDKMFDNVKDDQVLRNWIMTYIEEKLDKGTTNSWYIDEEIYSFAVNNIFQEKYQKEKHKNKNSFSADNFYTYKRDISQKLNDIKEKAEVMASDILTSIDKIGQDESLYSKDLLNGIKKFKNDIKSAFEEELKTLSKATNSDGWVKKTNVPNKIREEIKKEIEELGLPEKLSKLMEFREENKKTFHTCLLIKNNLNKLGLFDEIYKQISLINEEQGEFILSETSLLLQNMIDDSDAPFIFEKIGSSIHNIMIDEFQDTSRMQWDVFKPLLKECIGQNGANLIVGDPKQAIYRWRNGDWKIICDMEKYGGIDKNYINETFLDHNWRSMQRVIDFNNFLYNTAVDLIYKEYKRNGVFLDKMTKAYEKMDQKCAKEKNKNKGYVCVEFIRKQEEIDKKADIEEQILDALVERIKMLKDKGIEKGDIAILVRKNKYIPLIAERFAQEAAKGDPQYENIFDITSNEAYVLEQSTAIRSIVNALYYISDPTNRLYREQLRISYEKIVNGKNVTSTLEMNDEDGEIFDMFDDASLLPLYEMVEFVYEKLQLSNLAKEQQNYIYAFLDGVNRFIVDRSSDLNAFLKHWETTMHKHKVPFTDDGNAIHLMTIHKSKGLEFNTVIIPFCDWTTTSDNNNTLVWCEPKEEDFKGMPILPINYTKKAMSNSFFSEDYTEETEELLVDNINVMYVATTRAVNNLFILSPDCPENDNKSHSISNVSILLYDVLKSAKNGVFLDKYKEIVSQINFEEKIDRYIYTFGNLLCEGEKKDKIVEEENLMTPRSERINLSYNSNKRVGLFRQSNDSKLFISGEESEQDSMKYIDMGKVKHELFSMIETMNDIPTAAARLASRGIISNEEVKVYVDFAINAIRRDGCEKWFEEGLNIYNECDILFLSESEENESRRPDRIIEHNGEMTIIDYKFGNESKRYDNQVREYMQLATEMGFASKGYLWYVEKGIVKEVV